MLPNHIIRLCLSQKINKNVICLASQMIRSQPPTLPSQQSRQMASQQQSAITEKTTGWDKARFPQQEMLEIHRRAAKTEDPSIERRRRLQLVKLAIGIACVFAAWGLLFAFLIVAMPWDPYSGPW